MSREEKRRKFNDAVVNTLYPPPPSQPKEEDLEVSKYNMGLALYPITGDDFEGTGSSNASDNNDDETEPQKPTRAQRKRLRRKKLKSDSSNSRRKIIGPLLPPPEIGCIEHEVQKGDVGNEPPSVRENANEEIPAITYEPDEAALCLEEVEPSTNAKKIKVKQRRKAKKLARESLLVDRDQSAKMKSFDQEKS